MNTRLFRGLGLGLMFLVMLASCAPAAAPAISIESAWGMPSMSMPTAGALYMVIKNTGNAPDKLLSGTSPACGSIEVHEMVKKSDGTMGMNLLENPLEIAAGGQVELKSGGLHIMCIMKKDDQFKAGAKIDVKLKFEKAGEKAITAEIRMQ
jgi:copper(I)-binding protein